MCSCYFCDGIIFLLRVGRNLLRSRQALILENLALRSQLALFEQQVLAGKRPKPQPTLASGSSGYW